MFDTFKPIRRLQRTDKHRCWQLDGTLHTSMALHGTTRIRAPIFAYTHIFEWPKWSFAQHTLTLHQIESFFHTIQKCFGRVCSLRMSSMMIIYFPVLLVCHRTAPSTQNRNRTQFNVFIPFHSCVLCVFRSPSSDPIHSRSHSTPLSRSLCACLFLLHKFIRFRLSFCSIIKLGIGDKVENMQTPFNSSSSRCAWRYHSVFSLNDFHSIIWFFHGFSLTLSEFKRTFLMKRIVLASNTLYEPSRADSKIEQKSHEPLKSILFKHVCNIPPSLLFHIFIIEF